MVPLSRILKRGMKGNDVEACKRALRHYEVARKRKLFLKWPPNDQFNPQTVGAVKQFQHYHALAQDGQIGPHTYAALYPWLVKDGWAVVLMRKAQPQMHSRAAVKRELEYWIQHHFDEQYAMIRPIPLARYRQHLKPVRSDCSGSIIGCNFAAGAPDPSGNGYNGQGWTGDFLSHLAHIDRGGLQIADIIVFGWYPGVHAVAVLEVAADPIVYSHGHDGLPDDPKAHPLSYLESYFHSVGVYGETYCRVQLP